MRIFIDTAARWNSGFETHIKQFLSKIDNYIGKDEIILYGHSNLISKINHLSSTVNFITDDNIPLNSYRALNWRKKELSQILNHYAPDVHFNLIGWMHHNNNKIIRISMNRNLQPFIPDNKISLALLSKEYFRLRLYKRLILNSYNNCDGIIFNSDYAQEIISPFLNPDVKSIIINHGVNEDFFIQPRNHSKTNNLSILYVSDFYAYKNQENLIQAVFNLRKSEGIELKLNLVGDMNDQARKRIYSVLKLIDNTTCWLKFHQKIPNEQLKEHFLSNDIFVFASSVESFGHTLVEAMAAGMPIVCSDKRPMKDFIGSNAITFNEKSIEDISKKILMLIKDPDLRTKQANETFNKAAFFSYGKMTSDTLKFIRSFI